MFGEMNYDFSRVYTAGSKWRLIKRCWRNENSGRNLLDRTDASMRKNDVQLS